MKGLLYYKAGDLRYTEDLPEPQVENDNDVKIKVAYCGICGTDLHEYLEGPIFFPKNGKGDMISGAKMPCCPGHEMFGTVVSVGKGVKNVKAGDRVVIEATAHCSDRARYPKTAPKVPECIPCSTGKPNICKDINFIGLGTASGGFGQYIVYGADHILKIPDFVPLDAAALVEPMSVAWHAIERANFKPGQTALVLGGGPIGLASILALKGHKAGRIVVSEPALIRRQYAENLGAEVFNPAEHKDVNGDLRGLLPKTDGFDAAFDCSGIQATFTTSIEAIHPGGIAVNVAIWADKPITYSPMSLTYKEKIATGSMGYVVQDFADVIKALDNKSIPVESVKKLITGKALPKDGVEKGLKELINHKETNVKILIAPNGTDIV